MAKIGKRQQEIIDTLAAEGWKLITEKYETLDVEMEFECPKGHRVFSSWRQQRDQRYCPVCNKERLKSYKLKVPPKKKNTYRVLALDQSTHITGWCVIDDSQVVDFGAYTAPDFDEITRDNNIKMWFISMIENWKPDRIGLENVQYQQDNGGIDTLIILARLQGILMETCFDYNIPFVLCAPGTWRAHCKVTGSARADKKKSMQLKIKQWFDLDVTDDEADAIGICKYVTDTFRPKIEVVSWI